MKLYEKIILKIFPFLRQCQSCGFTLSKDENKGGTEVDGSRSKDYCSGCYWNGKFIHPDATQEQTLERFQTRLRMHGYREGITQYLLKKVRKEMPEYKRWHSRN